MLYERVFLPWRTNRELFHSCKIKHVQLSKKSDGEFTPIWESQYIATMLLFYVKSFKTCISYVLATVKWGCKNLFDHDILVLVLTTAYSQLEYEPVSMTQCLSILQSWLWNVVQNKGIDWKKNQMESLWLTSGFPFHCTVLHFTGVHL